jgi:hypothetical protein
MLLLLVQLPLSLPPRSLLLRWRWWRRGNARHPVALSCS